MGCLAPRISAPSFADAGFTDAVFPGQFCHHAATVRHSPYYGDIISSQNRRGISATLARVTVGNLVQHIIERASPLHVAGVVVRRVAIVVAAFVPLRRGAYKREKHQAMHFHQTAFSVFPQHYADAVQRFLSLGGDVFARPGRTNPPMVGHLIEPFVPNYWKPFFVHGLTYHNLGCGTS